MNTDTLRVLARSVAPCEETKSAAIGGLVDKVLVSPGYQLGAGDTNEISHEKKMKSIVPWMAAGLAGMAVGTGVGFGVNEALEATDVIKPPDPVGSALDTLDKNNVDVDVKHTPHPDTASYQLSQGASDNVRKVAPWVGGIAGGGIAHSQALKSQFLAGIRDAQIAKNPQGPWGLHQNRMQP